MRLASQFPAARIAASKEELSFMMPVSDTQEFARKVEPPAVAGGPDTQQFSNA
jgi:hypothetical protein